jgi:hypothetical protein
VKRIDISDEELAELAHVAQYGSRGFYGGGGLSAADLAQQAQQRFGLEVPPSEATVRRWLRGVGLTYAGGRWRKLPRLDLKRAHLTRFLNIGGGCAGWRGDPAIVRHTQRYCLNREYSCVSRQRGVHC